jgi:hypothetical protein
VTPRDLQAEQDHAEWHGWMDAQGYDFADDSYQAEAFAAGMQAERDLAAAQEPHAADGKTAGQQAYEGFYAGTECGPPVPWAQLTDWDEHWEAAGRAVETRQLRLAREDRDSLKRRVLDLAADLDNSAAATRPSKKSTIEDELAIALRKLLEA